MKNPTPYRVRKVQDEAKWECYRRVPVYGFHPEATRKTGIDEIYSVSSRRVDSMNEARRLNKKSEAAELDRR